MYQQLISLFENDVRLKKTIPKTYEIDSEKVKMWNEFNDLCIGPMEVTKVSFQDWQSGFARCLERILSDLSTGITFIMSTGISYLAKQSASELWTFYIARKMLELHGVKFEDVDKYWVKISKEKSDGIVNILFVDDFMFTGAHMSDRVCSSKFPSKKFDKILIVVATSMDDDGWRDVMKDFEEEYGVELLDRIEVFGGLRINLPRKSRLLFDHKSLEELNDDLHFGFLGEEGYMGSLILGADPMTPYQHPPALYHIEFGNGKLPEAHTLLAPIEGKPGFYKNSRQ